MSHLVTKTGKLSFFLRRNGKLSERRVRNCRLLLTKLRNCRFLLLKLGKCRFLMTNRKIEFYVGKRIRLSTDLSLIAWSVHLDEKMSENKVLIYSE